MNHNAHADWSEALDVPDEICREQPQPVPPISFETRDPQTTNPTSHRPSQWLADSRSFASRASSKASLASRRNRTRRTTVGSIGAPYDFKRVEHPRGRGEGYRPLILSIHLPGNELPSLPEFDEATLHDTCLALPPPALTKSRSEPLLSLSTTAFAIPRKPLPSRVGSMDVSRSSIDSRYTLDMARPSLSSNRQPSVAPLQSTHDFLDTLDARLPQSPPLSHAKSGPEPVYTLYRRASEQSLRLRTHLEERQQIERRFPECDTIMEDKEGDLEKSPVFARLTGSALLGEKDLDTPKQPSQAVQEVTYQRPRAPSTRTRISQWLLRANPASTLPPASKPEEAFYSLRPSSTHNRTSISSSVFSTSSTAAEPATAWTTPRSSPHRKESSLSSCQTMGLSTARGPSLDVEKLPGTVVVDVGLAF